MAAGLVGQNQITTFVSPVAGTSPIDANTVRGNDNTTKSAYNLHDSDGTIHLQSSAESAKPAAGTLGRKWLANDTGAVYLYYDTGAAWVEVDYIRKTGGAITGNLTISGTLGVTGATTLNSTLGVGASVSPIYTSSGRGNITVNGSGTAILVLTKDNSTSSYAYLYYNGTNAELRSSGNLTFTALGGSNIFGSDPGGSELVRVGGTFRASGNVTFGGTLEITGALTGVTAMTASGNINLASSSVVEFGASSGVQVSRTSSDLYLSVPTGGSIALRVNSGTVASVSSTTATLTNLTVALNDGYALQWASASNRLFFNGGAYRLDVNGTQRYAITTGGAHTLTGDVTVTGTISAAGLPTSAGASGTLYVDGSGFVKRA